MGFGFLYWAFWLTQADVGGTPRSGQEVFPAVREMAKEFCLESPFEPN
jgi:hypothetical protein